MSKNKFEFGSAFKTCNQANAMQFLLSLRLMTLTTALGLFVCACTMTVAHGHGGFLESGETPVGWEALMWGWRWGMLSGLMYLTWNSNLLWLFAFLCLACRVYHGASVLSAIGVCLSLIPLLSLVSGQIPELRLDEPMALVFAGGHLELHLGYFLWVGSSVTLFSGAVLLCFIDYTFKSRTADQGVATAMRQ